MLLIIFSVIITLLFPMFSIAINLFNFFICKKFRKVFALLIAISLGLIAYIWNSPVEYDLYRWHLQMYYFKYANISTLITYIQQNFEPINYLFKYIFSKSGDFNLLQFSIVSIGYFEILWMIADYSKLKNIQLKSVILTTLFTILSLKFLDFISGLFFNFAIINFALGIYLEYIKGKKTIPWIFYLISVMTHISTLYILLLLLIIKFVNIKNYKFFITIIFFTSLLIGPILTFLNSHTTIYIVQYIYRLYNSYFITGDRFDYLHAGKTLIFSLIRLFICLAILFMEKKSLKKYNDKYVKFILITSISILAIIINAKIYIRFIFFIQLISIPILLNFFEKKLLLKNFIINIIIISFLIPLLITQYKQMKASNLFIDIDNNLISNVFMLKNGEQK